MDQQSAITETQTEEQRLDDLKPDPGIPDGSEVFTIAGAPTGEIVVYEYDEAGEITGWHKEII